MNDEKTFDNATHILLCSHVLAGNSRYYSLRAHVLKTMDDGRKKVLAFGGMWKGMEKHSRVRYVEAHRLTERV